jgi:hypothetical protein
MQEEKYAILSKYCSKNSYRNVFMASEVKYHEDVTLIKLIYLFHVIPIES